MANVIKLKCKTPDTYLTLIKHFRENNIYYHTYQLKQKGLIEWLLNISITPPWLKTSHRNCSLWDTWLVT
jgi:hypothetical protein